jgi:hypothetical protein
MKTNSKKQQNIIYYDAFLFEKHFFIVKKYFV